MSSIKWFIFGYYTQNGNKKMMHCSQPFNVNISCGWHYEINSFCESSNYQTIVQSNKCVDASEWWNAMKAICDKNQWHIISIDAAGMNVGSRLEFTTFFSEKKVFSFSSDDHVTYYFSISWITEFWKKNAVELKSVCNLNK